MDYVSAHQLGVAEYQVYPVVPLCVPSLSNSARGRRRCLDAQRMLRRLRPAVRKMETHRIQSDQAPSHFKISDFRCEPVVAAGELIPSALATRSDCFGARPCQPSASELVQVNMDPPALH
jgi:hypothetical protein